MKVYLNSTSNAPMRVRIAIALKEMDIEQVQVDLEANGGDQHAAPFSRLNPQRMIPVLVDGEHVISQSLAIIEYLEECQPVPALLPRGAAARARVRALAMVMACEGQPLVNLRVRQYLKAEMGLSEPEQARWIGHWMRRSLREYEALLDLDPVPGRFSHGDQWTLADVCLVPQVLMARRFGIAVDEFPGVARIFEQALQDPRITSAIR